MGMQIRLIEGLGWSREEDAEGWLCNARGEKVHLRQGEMDGACGPYCLAMAMLVRNQISRAQARGFEPVDGRSHYGRLMQAQEGREPLVRVGTTGDDLLELLSVINDREHQVCQGPARRILELTREHLQRNVPVLLGFHGRAKSAIRHWGLVIGGNEDVLVMLDPAHRLQPGSAWNAVIDTRAEGKVFGYRYINPRGTWAVKLKEMLALL